MWSKHWIVGEYNAYFEYPVGNHIDLTLALNVIACDSKEEYY